MSSSRRQFIAKAAAIGGAVLGSQRMLAAEAAQATGGKPLPLAPPDREPPKLEVPDPVRKKIGYAIVGLGELALEEILPAFGSCRLSTPVALVSGHPEKARKVAETYGIKSDAIYDYESYDKLAQDERVQVIYIVLPNSMHAEFTIRGLRAGKDVLCEKPMAGTVEECERMIAAEKETGKKLAIAYRLHYEPLNRRVMELCAKKAFGKIKTFESSNCQNTPAPNIRLSAKLGGGPVGDVGVYSINAARYVIGEEPEEIFAFAHQPKDDPRFREVPESVSFTMRYPSGVLAHCVCSFGTAESRRYRVNCTEGFIEMDPAFSYRGLKLRVKRGDAKEGNAENAEQMIEQVNHFASEMDGFSQSILENKPTITPASLGLADMKIVTAIMESAKTGRAVRL